KNWTRYSPQVRSAVMLVLTNKPALIGVLFDAIEQGTVAATDIPPARRTQLMHHAVPAIRDRAETIFKRFESGDRMQVYRSYRDVLALKPDLARGREVFMRVCSTCH